MRRVFVTAALAALAALAAGPAAAAPWEKSGIPDWTRPPPDRPERDFRPPTARRLRLASGLAVLVVERHQLPLVAMTLVVPGAGSASDPPGKAGLAAFTADLLDEGAADLDALAVSDTIERLGASLSCYASVEAAYVEVTTLADTLEPTLDLLAKVVGAPRFAAGDVARVQRDLVAELELRRDRPSEVAALVFRGALFGPRSAYGHPTSGYLEDVKGLTVADARAFHAAAWDPRAATLVVVGDVEPEALRARLEAVLGGWKPAAGRLRRPPVKAAPARGRLLVVDRPGAAQSVVRVGLVTIRRTDPRYFKFSVLHAVLGVGFTSRLTQRLREQLGYTYGAGARATYLRRSGSLTIVSSLFTPKTADAFKEILVMVADLAARDVPEAELTRAKQSLVRGLPGQFETNADIADQFGELALFRLPDDWYAGYAAGVRKVTARDVRAAARALLPARKLVFTVVGDLAAIRQGIEALGLGKVVLYDVEGRPVSRRPSSP